MIKTLAQSYHDRMNARPCTGDVSGLALSTADVVALMVVYSVMSVALFVGFIALCSWLLHP